MLIFFLCVKRMMCCQIPSEGEVLRDHLLYWDMDVCSEYHEKIYLNFFSLYEVSLAMINMLLPFCETTFATCSVTLVSLYSWLHGLRD